MSFRVVRFYFKLILVILKIIVCKSYFGMLDIVVYVFYFSSFKVEGGRILSFKLVYFMSFGLVRDI